MLLVNGALAVFNGMFVTTCRILCECLRGGVFCGGVCRCPDEEGNPEEGECCGDEWYTDPGECCDDEWIDENGEVEGREGEWVCCDDTNGTVTFEILAPDDPGCGGILQRCCTDGVCTTVPPEECGGEVLFGSCERFGCPKSCCEERDDGVVTCGPVDVIICSGTVDEEPCETACKGACCTDGTATISPETGEPVGLVKQSECEALGGCFLGVGSTSCEEQTLCREPFDADCCEHVVSSAAKITFTGPRKRRCPELDACGFQVTVTVKTGQPVYIHGGLFGSPYEACTDVVTFLLCNDEFYVTPAPCSGNLENLDIEVCWADASGGPETLRFHCCQDTTYVLGNCVCDCATTLLYEGDGCTSNAVIQMRGDATIDASGTGPLVLTANITHGGSCERTLTLTGTSTHDNELSGAIQNGPGATDVEKTGPGLWRLSGLNSYSGRLKVLDGTLVVAIDVNASGNSPFGSNNGEDFLPIIGSSAAGVTGTAALLIEGSRTIDRGMSIAALGAGSSQAAVLGITGTGSATFADSITLGRGVTLQASNSGTVTFANDWVNAGDPVAFTIGSEGNAGVVVLESQLPTSTGVSIVRGTARLQIFSDDRINPATPVTVEAATFDTNGQSQSLDSLTVNGVLTIDGEGSLTVSALDGGGSVSQADGTFTINGVNTLTGTLTVNGGTTVVNQIVSGPALVTSATFTSASLTVAFSGPPSQGDQFVLLAGPTGGSYSPVLTGAGGATGTYDSATSTLTID